MTSPLSACWACFGLLRKKKEKRHRLLDDDSASQSSSSKPSSSASSSARRADSVRGSLARLEQPPVYKDENGDCFVAFFTNRYVFSNHFRCPESFCVDGKLFPTSEHYYMYRKALFAKEEKAAERILAEPDPKAAKRICQGFRDFDTRGWDKMSVEVMRKGVRAKFEQNPLLRAELFKTGKATLVEASPMDTRWGVGLDREDRDVARPARWRGQNLLGQVLMATRTMLEGDFPEEVERLKPAVERMRKQALPI